MLNFFGKLKKQYYEYIMIDLIVNGALIRGFSVHYSLTSQQGFILPSVNLNPFHSISKLVGNVCFD